MAANPRTSEPGKLERQQALLAKLEGRLFRASQLPEALPSAAPTQSIALPGIERVENRSGIFSRVITTIEFSGKLTAQGIGFPHVFSLDRIVPTSLALLSQESDFNELPLESLAFIDCETTGLSGGTGTFPFLVGVGFFRGEQFVVEQFFMEDYDEEPAMIEALAERMREFEALVSYNGKTFDVPLLRTRFIFHRRPSAWEKPHLDLLHCARRFWKGRICDCSLHSVERHVLGVRRISDVAGSLIPQIYFDYVRGRRREQMIPVFDHHAQDIVSLAALAAQLSRMVHTPLDSEALSAEDHVRLGAFFAQCGQEELACNCYECALQRLRDPLAIHTISMRLARVYKRRGQWSDACDIWQAQIDSGPAGRIEPYVELAKFYEHQARDHTRALAIVERAIAAAGTQEELRRYIPAQTNFDSAIDELFRRLERLQARVRRHGQTREATDGN